MQSKSKLLETILENDYLVCWRGSFIKLFTPSYLGDTKDTKEFSDKGYLLNIYEINPKNKEIFIVTKTWDMRMN